MTDPTDTLDSVRAFASTYLVPAGIHVAVAIGVFVVGRFIARWLLRGADRVMERGNVDISLRKFLGSMLYAVMFVALLVASLDTVGVRTTAIVAVIGAAGITIGLALQGALSNFAAGVVLIMFRPYKVSDLVVIGKYLGKVDAIKAFNTVMVTPDGREVTLPNSLVLGGPVENLTVRGRRRIDLLVTIDGDRELAQLKALVSAHDRGRRARAGRPRGRGRRRRGHRDRRAPARAHVDDGRGVCAARRRGARDPAQRAACGEAAVRDRARDTGRVAAYCGVTTSRPCGRAVAGTPSEVRSIGGRCSVS